jgi:hypothetical protein
LLTRMQNRRHLRTTDRPASEVRFALHPVSASGAPAHAAAAAAEGANAEGTVGPLTVTFSPEGRVVALRSGWETATPAAAHAAPAARASAVVAGTGSGRTGSMASAAAAVSAASRAALYDGELSAAREADGFGTLTFSNGDVYRGEQLSPSLLPMHSPQIPAWAVV